MRREDIHQRGRQGIELSMQYGCGGETLATKHLFGVSEGSCDFMLLWSMYFAFTLYLSLSTANNEQVLDTLKGIQ